jgi:hypothetical protein
MTPRSSVNSSLSVSSPGYWTAPRILEALSPGRMQSHAHPGQLTAPLALSLPDLQDHLHRAFTQLIGVLPLCRHVSCPLRGLRPPGGRVPARRTSRAVFSAVVRASSVATLGVGVGGQRDRGMPQLILNHFQVRARGQRQGGRAVPQVMQPDRRQARLCGELAESAGQPVGGHRSPVEVGEHEPAGPVSQPVGGSLGLLSLPASAQRGHRIEIPRLDRHPHIVAIREPGSDPG